MIKYISILIAFLISFDVYAQGHWTYDSTSRIKIQGTLLWPKKDSTLSQRKALLREWALSKLTDARGSEIATWANDGQLVTTYNGLPGIAYLDYRKKEQFFRLTYDVKLIYNAIGIKYILSNFEYVISEEDVTTPFLLEEALQSSTISKEAKEAIGILGEKLFYALHKW